MVWDSLNPRFAAGMTLRERCDPAFLGSRANTWLRFVVLDADDKNPDKPVAELELVGETELPLADWLKAAADGGGRTTRPLRRPRSKKAAAKSFGSLTMVSERLVQPPGSGGGVARVSMRAADLPNVDGVFGKSDPFVVWKRGPPVDRPPTEGGYDFVKVHQTEWISDQLDPIWRPFELPLGRLCNGQAGRALEVCQERHPHLCVFSPVRRC